MERAVQLIREELGENTVFHENVPLSLYTTLQAGGPARFLVEVRRIDAFAKIAALAQALEIPHIILGSGSNVLPSDSGFDGLAIVNSCGRIEIGDECYAETGCWFQDLFLKAAQKGRGGLEFAVGIPGTLGGALVSNAGAYRANIADRLISIEIVQDGERRWTEPSHLEFAYRDSILRRPNPPAIALLAVRLDLPIEEPKTIYDRARDYQRQRISKQPPHASAGSFFKNVMDKKLAQQVAGLSDGMRESGVVPAGFLIEACGLKGETIGGAKISRKHANYICNTGRATAADIRSLAELAKSKVKEKFGVELEEEVLYIGDWGQAA